MPLRVLMVADFYAPYVGGVEQHVRSLSHALVARGHHVSVATLRTDRAPDAEEDDDGVTVHRVASSATRSRRAHADPDRPWAPPFLDPTVTAGLRRIVASERPDVVHGHDWMGRSAWPLCRPSRPLVLSLHYYTHSCAKKSLWFEGRPCPGPSPGRCVPCATSHFGVAKGLGALAANRLGARIDEAMTSAFIAVSGATATGNGLPNGRARCWVVPNPLPDKVSPLVPAGLDLPLPDEPFILYVGDLRIEKGLDVLLDAYGRMRSAPPLVLLGEAMGNGSRPLPPGVVALGPVPNAAVMEAWRRCSFGVVPSV